MLTLEYASFSTTSSLVKGINPERERGKERK
jgi:hypothetical protein